jgi:hypothetical protein
MVLQYFQDQAGHAIDAGITAGNDAHCLPCQGALDGELGSGHLLGQGEGNTFFVLHQVRYPLEIAIIPNDNIRALERCPGLSREQR